MVLKDKGAETLLYDQYRSNYEAIENTDEAINAKRLLISVPMELVEVSKLRNKNVDRISYENRTNPLILPLYLLVFLIDSILQPFETPDCPNSKKYFEQRISGLDITSDSNISSEYLAGTDLSDHFRLVRSIAEFTRKDSGRWKHISSFLDYDPLQIPTVKSAVKDGIYLPETLGIFFDSDGELIEESSHIFTITLSFENGDVFTINTDPVTLK